MPVLVTWHEIVLRLALATAAGLLVGFNRQAHGQVAGLRTTTLVCLAACLMMVLANLLLGTAGKDPTKFARIDVLRLPLGILSGMGFLGAGAILRRGDVVVGVTTAATLWFMTCVGICFGSGQLQLGGAGTGLGLAVLWGLRWVDEQIPRNLRGTLSIRAQCAGLPEDEFRRRLAAEGYRVIFCAVSYEDNAQLYEIRADLERRGLERDRAQEPDFVKDLAASSAVLRVDWASQHGSA